MAQEEGHIDRDVSPSQLSFELNALFFGANFSFYLRDDQQAIDRVREAIHSRLEGQRESR